MTWSLFPIFAVSALLLWFFSALTALKDRIVWTVVFSIAGICVFSTFIALMWLSLERPPMRTMGETRLWYVFFLSLTGLLIYSRWHYKWIPSFSLVMCCAFTLINLLKTEIHNKNLMPALQSPWFTPHVTVYMFAYALFGAAALMAIYLLWIKHKIATADELSLCDNLVGVGLALMTMGMLFGALWAEQAWGHYWAWDPKETWAAATWLAYLSYIHLRHSTAPGDRRKIRTALFFLLISFVFLQVCWWGINFLPSAQGVSIHTYTQ